MKGGKDGILDIVKHRPLNGHYYTCNDRSGAGERTTIVALMPVALHAQQSLPLFCNWSSYSSWRRIQKPLSLRPSGARSSHW